MSSAATHRCGLDDAMAGYDVLADAVGTNALKVVLGADQVGPDLVEREEALAGV